MIFEDRVSAYPNRYLMTNESGSTSYVVLERADDPVKVGTPLNAETFNNLQSEIRVESTDHPGCFYRNIGDQVEWFNPPMEIEVEYRTTERFMGLPVYTKLIKATLPSTSGTNTVTIGIPDARGILSHDAYYTALEDTVSAPYPAFLAKLYDEDVEVRTRQFGFRTPNVLIVTNRDDTVAGNKFVILARYVKDTVPQLS